MTQALITRILLGLVVTSGLSLAFLGGKVTTLSSQQNIRTTQEPSKVEYIEPEVIQPEVEEVGAPKELKKLDIDWDEITREQAEMDKQLQKDEEERQEKLKEQQEEFDKWQKEFNDDLKKQAEQREKEREEAEENAKKYKLTRCLQEAKDAYSLGLARLGNYNTADSSAGRNLEISFQNSLSSCNSLYGN